MTNNWDLFTVKFSGLHLSYEISELFLTQIIVLIIFNLLMCCILSPLYLFIYFYFIIIILMLFMFFNATHIELS